jgi:hypothetical protein
MLTLRERLGLWLMVNIAANKSFEELEGDKIGG